MHRDILPQVIFSPADLALHLAEGLQRLGADVTLFSPGPVDTQVHNVHADLSLFERELAGRGYGYVDLLKKHPATFIAMARQVQSELIADAYARANAGEFDLVHIYTNEEDIALSFAALCVRPIVFTHHDPFNFLIKYKNVFPKYRHLPWISLSNAQRADMPADTNWLATIYHGLSEDLFLPRPSALGHADARVQASQRYDYVLYLGRIIEPKGVHLAIEAVKAYNRHAKKPLVLKIAGKHYAGHNKDSYWNERIKPRIDNREIRYIGFASTHSAKQELLQGAQAVLVPSLFAEPFGMVAIEALASGTPVVALDSGALPEIVEDGRTGYIVPKQEEDDKTAAALAEALTRLPVIRRQDCRSSFEKRFTLERMCQEHLDAYGRLVQQHLKLPRA